MISLAEQVKTAFDRASQTIGQPLLSEKLIVGVSGGPDSLALIDVMTQLHPPDRLVVAHLDHQLRPTSSSESEIVARVAGDYGLSCYIERVDVRNLALESGKSIEEAGRDARYQFLATVARREGTQFVVVGHHADDQAETILMHFLRGSGPAGLRGMQVISSLPGASDLWLLRPFLEATRDEIDAYCRAHDLSPLYDLTNTDTTYHRNRLRHELLPVLETYNPNIRQRLREMAHIFAAEEDFMSGVVSDQWAHHAETVETGEIRLNHAGWQSEPLAIRRRLLRQAASEVNPNLRDLSFRALESARLIAETGISGSKADLGSGVYLIVDYDELLITGQGKTSATGFPQLPSDEPIPLPVPGYVELMNGWYIEAHYSDLIEYDRIVANTDSWQAYVDLNPFKPLIIRSRYPGETMRPLGLGGKTPLKEVMINRKIPARARDRWPIVATGLHAVWVVGHLLDERVKVKPDSHQTIHLRCSRGDHDFSIP
jgi:tRNA(Ile)-lysidine synthase